MDAAMSDASSDAADAAPIQSTCDIQGVWEAVGLNCAGRPGRAEPDLLMPNAFILDVDGFQSTWESKYAGCTLVEHATFSCDARQRPVFTYQPGRDCTPPLCRQFGMACWQQAGGTYRWLAERPDENTLVLFSDSGSLPLCSGRGQSNPIRLEFRRRL